jgi:uncharacterized tellurite resistance protein B-like protein
MLDRILKRLARPATEEPEAREDAARAAIAAVLVEAAHADGAYLESERAVIDRILAERFGLDADGAARLRASGEEAHAEAADLVRFTRVLKDTIPIEERVEVIEAVWRVIYADDQREAHEANLVRRLCGLLYVPDREAGLARQRVTGGGG